MAAPIYTLEPLPYDKNALEPVISKETVEFHYGKHHSGYVDKLNAFLNANKDYPRDKTLEQLILTYPTVPAIFNNAAQIWNHNFYWKSLTPIKAPALDENDDKKEFGVIFKDSALATNFKDKI